jgi:hypothetical protein
MLKRFSLLAAFAIAALAKPAIASSVDIGGDPVKAISPEPSSSTVYSQTNFYPFGPAPSVVIVTPVAPYSGYYNGYYNTPYNAVVPYGVPYSNVPHNNVPHHNGRIVTGHRVHQPRTVIVTPNVPTQIITTPSYSRYCGSSFGLSTGSFSISSNSGCW